VERTDGRAGSPVRHGLLVATIVEFGSVRRASAEALCLVGNVGLPDRIADKPAGPPRLLEPTNGPDRYVLLARAALQFTSLASIKVPRHDLRKQFGSKEALREGSTASRARSVASRSTGR